MDATILIEKHLKAIKILNAIKEAEHRIDSHDTYSYEIDCNYEWNIERITINKQIKQRLQNYYNNNFKI